MTRIALATLLALFLFAAPTFAGEDEAEALFHEAYIQEVVEGQVPVAAKTYLAIAEDESASQRIRAEARFRFAVCATLLGRVDEARSWFGELANDESAPESVRQRAKSYLESLSSVGVGTELDKKLQELVFQLGRADVTSGVPVYRDFEILGEKAVPFLKQLLHHEDQKLRQHAFAILCRMEVPGMGEAWHAGIPWASGQHGYALRRYFDRFHRADEVDVLEAKLLGLEEDSLLSALGSISRSSQRFSLDFARALAKREEAKRFTLTFYPYAAEADASWEQLQRWLDGDDPVLANLAATYVLKFGSVASPFPDAYAASLFPGVVRQILQPGTLIYPNNDLTMLQSADALLDALDVTVTAAEAWEGSYREGPVGKGLVARLLKDLERKPPEEVDLARFDGLFRRFLLTELPIVQERRRSGQASGLSSVNTLRYLLQHLPTEAALVLTRWVLTDALADAPLERRRVVQQMPTERPENVPAYVEAIRIEGDKGTLRSRMTNRATSEPARGAFFRALPDLVAFLDAENLTVTMRYMPKLARFVPRNEAVEVMRDVLVRLSEGSASWRQKIAHSLFQAYDIKGGAVPAPTFVATIVVPAAESLWETLPADLRALLLSDTAGLLKSEHEGSLVIPAGREVLAGFLANHLDEVGDTAWGGVAAASILIPLETWIPLAPRAALPYTKLASQERRNGAGAALAARPETPNASTLQFMAGYVSQPISRAFYDALLRSQDPARHGPALDQIDRITGTPASLEAVEDALELLVQAEETDLRRLGKASRILAARKPSKKLFPAAKALLGSEDRQAVVDGIEVAYALGQEDLVEDLIPHLGSMDLEVRRQAKRTLDSIQEIRRIQDEALLKKAGLAR